MKFKVVVKNGDSTYELNKKTGSYETKYVDYGSEFETFEEALEEFLSWVADEYREKKVSLVALPKKVKS